MLKSLNVIKRVVGGGTSLLKQMLGFIFEFYNYIKSYNVPAERDLRSHISHSCTTQETMRLREGS